MLTKLIYPCSLLDCWIWKILTFAMMCENVFKLKAKKKKKDISAKSWLYRRNIRIFFQRCERRLICPGPSIPLRYHVNKEVSIFAIYLLLVSFCSLLITSCSLLSNFYLLARFSLLFIFCFSLCSVFSPCYFFLLVSYLIFSCFLFYAYLLASFSLVPFALTLFHKHINQ